MILQTRSIKFGLMQVHRVEVAKVLKDRKYDWYLFLEDDANFKLGYHYRELRIFLG